jgi:DNA-binding transcriptional LysR family regulator
VHELFPLRLNAACSPDFLLKHPIHDYADLNGKTLLVHEERRDDWERWALGLGISPINANRLIRMDTMAAVVLAAEQGVGVALVPSRLSAERFMHGSLAKVFDTEFATNERYVLLHRTEDDAREDLQELAQWILNEFRVAKSHIP